MYPSGQLVFNAEWVDDADLSNHKLKEYLQCAYHMRRCIIAVSCFVIVFHVCRGGCSKCLFFDEDLVMIKDKFPKSIHHALIISRDPTLDNVGDLQKEHVPLLKHMSEVADGWIQQEGNVS